MQRVNWDRWGALASSICAVHCLLTGVAFGLLSVAGLGILGSEPAEWTFVVVTVSLGITALVHGLRKHHSLAPAMIFSVGMVCLLVSKTAFGHDHHAVPENAADYAHTALNVMAGLCLVTFHVVNQRLQKSCGLHCNH